MPAVGIHGLPNQVPWGPTCWRGFRHDHFFLRSSHTGLVNESTKHDHNGGLRYVCSVAKDTRVMLLRNLNPACGLSNFL